MLESGRSGDGRETHVGVDAKELRRSISSSVQAAVGGARGLRSAASRVRMLTGSVTAARTMSLPPSEHRREGRARRFA